ncbi:MAG: transglycosylase SLT domain-containing protein [Alphaproteobacteria bacterium]
MRRALLPLAVFVSLIGLSACETAPPKNQDNACEIFRHEPSWFHAMERAEARWGAPIHIQLAIMRQESAFKARAKAPRDHILWVIPWGRKSSAYGYAQAQDPTWDWYRDKSGNWNADRDDFDDAADFVSWYVAQTTRMTGLSKWNAYGQYLAYHEGQGGYKRGTYNSKPWLISVARKVERNANIYSAQIAKCRDEFDGPWWWPF